MFQGKKILIYILIFLFIISLIIPTLCFAEDSIYVWSNNSSSISTSIVPESNDNTISEDTR